MVVQHKGSSLFYTRHGKGKKILLLFHGFGQNNTIFKNIIDALSEHYTCFAFDLYFHGSSEWHSSEKPLKKKKWKKIIKSFLRENNISDFSLVGYSLGGKFALATVCAFQKKVNELILIAPDGIRINFWYKLATYPVVTRKIFKSLISHPGRFETISKIARSLGLLDKSALRFADSQMNTTEKRKQVYNTWVVFRELRFQMKNIAAIINQNHIRLLIVVGRYDKVIKMEDMNRLLRYVNEYEIEIIDAGHNGLLESNTAKLIAPR